MTNDTRRGVRLLTALALATVAGPAAAEDWATFGLDGARTRRSVERTGEAFAPAWQLRLPAESAAVKNAILSTPAVADGVAVFGTMAGAVRAVRAGDGHELWSAAVGGMVQASPLLHRGRVYVPGFDDRVYALRLADGAVAWKAELGGSTVSSPVLVTDARGEGLLVAAGHPRRALVRLDARTGAVVWKSPEGTLERSSHSSVAVSGGHGVIGVHGGTYHGFDVLTGAARWRLDTGGGVFLSAPLLADGTVHLVPGGDAPQAFAVDLVTGAPRPGWPVALAIPADAEAAGTIIKQERAVSSPVLAGGAVVVQVRGEDHRDTDRDGAADLFVLRELLFALDAKTGQVRWTLPLGRRDARDYDGIPAYGVCPTPVVLARLDGAPLLAVASSLSATIRVVDPGPGRVVWTGASAGPTRSSPVFANGSLIVATDAGTVEAFASRVNRPPPPPAPLGRERLADESQPVLRWSQPADPDGDALTAVVRLDRDGELLESFEHEVTAGVNATTVALPRSLQAGVAYSYAVRTRDARGALSPWSAPATLKLVATPSVTLGGAQQDSLAAALASARPGEAIHLGAGVFHLGETLRLPPGVTLVGGGPQATVLAGQPGAAGLSLSGRAAGHRTVIRSLTVAGAEVGVEVIDGAEAELRNVVLRGNVEAGATVAAGASLLVANATIAANGAGVVARGTATVKNSLVLDNATGLAARAGGALTSRYNDLFDNATAYEGLASDATDLAKPIAFADRGAHDFRLPGPNAATDRGDPADEYGLEPAPNGERVNLGAFGNTPEAELSAPATGEAPPLPPAPGKRARGCAVGGPSAEPGPWLVLLLLALGAVRRRGDR